MSESPVDKHFEIDLPIAERRSRRTNIRLPKRFRDILPEPAPSLPVPAAYPVLNPTESSVHDYPHFSTGGFENHSEAPLEPSQSTHSIHSHIQTKKSFRTPRNIFRLVRRYFTDKPPSFDPEELVSLEELSSDLTQSDSVSGQMNSVETLENTSFYPYPNKSSFRLGDWYWNGGVQKSQESFKDLVDIVGDPSFEPADIRTTKWTHINKVLGENEQNNPDNDNEWQDDLQGWRKSPIEISVPFHRRMKTPGTRNYIGAELYHRPLVDAIKEKITDPTSGWHFHMEPYDLLWRRTEADDEVRMHGELYTSKLFIDAHQELQASPGEPGCDLPRVIVGMMFASDATHLTSFGNSKLWPCYLFFGNESKYRRCRPSCKSCTHVAYFQNVGPPILRLGVPRN